MGKISKSKSKQSSKQERALHLKNVKLYEKTISTLDKKLFSLGNERKRERIGLLEEQLQLTLNMEDDFAFINRYQSYRLKLSGICSHLLFDQIDSDNYFQTFNAYNEMMKYPLTEEFRSCIKPFSNLFFLQTNTWVKFEIGEKFIIHIHQTGRDALRYASEIVRGIQARIPLRILFLTKVLTELSRSSYLFETLENFSLNMLKLATDVDLGEGKRNKNKKQWVVIASTFLVCSHIDEFRFSLYVNQQGVKYQEYLEKIPNRNPNQMQLYDYLPSSTAHIAYSLLEYYQLICKKEEHSSESAKAVADKCIKSLEKYIALKSNDSQRKCHTCHNEDTPNHESLVCQGCRVVSYCCKHHQRLNYLHHEEMGTRGLGHKQLCPVFKAYRRKMNNADTSKEGHLKRKFQRACKRFLRGTLENELQRRPRRRSTSIDRFREHVTSHEEYWNSI